MKTPTQVRFGKNTVTEALQRAIDDVQQEHGFDPRNGYAQVTAGDDEMMRAYGAYDALVALADRLRLAVNVQGRTKRETRIEAIVAQLRAKPGEDDDPTDPRSTLTVENIELGQGWECPQSPTGHCVYNTETDECRDECVVCGEPEERK